MEAKDNARLAFTLPAHGLRQGAKADFVGEQGLSFGKRQDSSSQFAVANPSEVATDCIAGKGALRPACAMRDAIELGVELGIDSYR